MDAVKITSCMAGNMDRACKTLACALGERMGIPVEFVGDVPWQERERLFDSGQISACWICGLPYVWKHDQKPGSVELLAAPVFRGERYADRPIYFSDVLVRVGSRYQSFEDLRGVVWAYNEPGSHSGYALTRATLARRGETGRYFAQVVEAGAHQTALRMLMLGAVDATAIDSTVLEMELERDPTIAGQVHTIAVLGPSPAPPWVVSTNLEAELRAKLRQAFLELNSDPRAREALDLGHITRFEAVSDEDYDPIREADRLSRTVAW